MRQQQFSGILELGKMLFSRLKCSPMNNARPYFNFRPQKKSTVNKYTAVNPLQNIIKGLTSSLSKMKKSEARVNYISVVNKFLPEGVSPLKPKHPVNSKQIHFADLDGDSRNELIVSYKANEGIKTLILKNRNGNWEKIGEIDNSAFDTLIYCSTGDITGSSRRNLILGLKSAEKGSKLFGYSLEDNITNELFSLNCDKFEVLTGKKTRDGLSKAQIAIWNRNIDDDTYDVKILDWDGAEFQQVNEPSYYYSRLVPYYTGKIKQNPYSPVYWYNLADTLIKSGADRDALIAIEAGTRVDSESQYKDRFISLKSRIKT
jgi:hypothetical protein